MPETTLKITSSEGEFDATLLHPAVAGPWPVVILYMDAGGLRPVLSAVGERLAAAGFAVVVPDLYWRLGPFAPFDPATVFGDPVERQRLMGMVHSVTQDTVVFDTRAVIASLEQDSRFRSDRVGVLGYCMGGRAAFVVASKLGQRIAASASIHPGGLVTDAPDSPHLSAPNIKAEVYVAAADEDGSFTLEQQQKLHDVLKEAGVTFSVELYPGAKHGFAMKDFPVYDETADERHWQRIVPLFQRHLR